MLNMKIGVCDTVLFQWIMFIQVFMYMHVFVWMIDPSESCDVPCGSCDSSLRACPTNTK